jgi:hypothetical protein
MCGNTDDHFVESCSCSLPEWLLFMCKEFSGVFYLTSFVSKGDDFCDVGDINLMKKHS